MINKEFDIVIFGATSFVGKILCNYLVNEYTEPNLTWAMAARSETKLNELKVSLGGNAAAIPLIIADSSDEQTLHSMCEKTELVISTVGPYALYGELLVKTCCQLGTDYCDLTGEPQWIRRMIGLYEDDAKRSGARIVNCCGFDSIPSDLGVKFLQDHAQRHFGSYCDQVKLRVKVLKGGASGGTIASGLNLYKEASADPEIRKEMRDPYSLCPPQHAFTARQHNVSVEFDEDFDSWAGPFIMASINTRIVLRSNALLNGHYDENFEYDEAMLTSSGKKGEKAAKRISFGTKVSMFMMAFAPMRWLATRFFLPSPGEGPTPEQQLNGCYDLRLLGRTQRGERVRVKVTGDRDPGYGSTAKMLAQAGISLRRDVDEGEVGGGFWTPATVFNEKLITRLVDYAGMDFELESISQAMTAIEESTVVAVDEPTSPT
ncbi:MAG: saccharopine dehydrogenase [SAR86 cluster bacterium]|uniref:Saccharopine dehydrogenase n=1 Tax=SAR86 cluster bacterium TaxID=2030880 RepID=A0A2A4X008_9GAMM|nr:MAG: saccharopine dehydrogenase [SAR86 cluster bacterium]